MTDEPVSPPAPTPTPKRAAPRAEQDQEIANMITETRQMIGVAQDDAELAALLATRGYDADTLAEGLSLQQAAQDAFTARQAASAAQKQAIANATEAEAAARQAYTDFRQTARALFAASAERAALGLTGDVPRDAQKFITLARASYAAAQSAPYAAALSKYGFSGQAVAALDAFSKAGEAQNAAAAAAVKATADRDATAKALKQWSKQFKSIAAVALRAQPTQAKKLGL
ncbi:MAG: hypothetical protein WA821_10980 [Anaerolineales bacterium]